MLRAHSFRIRVWRWGVVLALAGLTNVVSLPADAAPGGGGAGRGFGSGAAFRGGMGAGRSLGAGTAFQGGMGAGRSFGSGAAFRGSSGARFGSGYYGGPRYAGGYYGGSRYGSGYYGSSSFGFALRGNNYRVSFGTTYYDGHRPYYHGYRHGGYYGSYYPYYSSYPYYYPYYPAYYGGFYPYDTGLYLRYYPSYSSLYPLRSRTVYVYTAPEVRTYGEPAPPSGELRPVPESRRTPHPYDDPVAPTPERGSLDEALTHIRTAWLREDLELLTLHLPAGDAIALYHDGDLRRELSATEFTRLTREAVRETRTLRFRFSVVERPAADEAIATALHTYVTEDLPDRDAQTVTLRYELVRRDGVWVLKAVHVGPIEGE